MNERRGSKNGNVARAVFANATPAPEVGAV